MEVGPEERLSIRTPEDVQVARQAIKHLGEAQGFDSPGQARLEVLAAELGTNLVRHADHGGTLGLAAVSEDGRLGVRLRASDTGPGIGDLEVALAADSSTAGSYGDGLASVRELADRFAIASRIGEGTRIEVLKWA